jgi:DNA primase
VSARTRLRRAGARWTGLCPFHEERTPSFSVNPQEKLYYCFGCGAGGDVIKFVRETEQLDFAEAVEWLAERFRVPLEYEESSPQVDQARARRERLHALLERATKFFEHALWEGKGGAPVRDYLAERGLREEVCREYRLGLAARGLARKARESGFTDRELLAAGLLNRRGKDWFPIGRLVFPLADSRGRVVGFGARRLRDDDPLHAKYVNSPEGELFHKSDLVYGLDHAKGPIAKQDRALVVEGYTDVLALQQAGIEPVVASMGTALTERQLKELSRLTRHLYLCFDADSAGEEATLRGMELAESQGFHVDVLAPPSGKDPADEPEAFSEEALARAVPYQVHRVQLAIDRAASREEALEAARTVLARFDQNTRWLDAVRRVSERLDLPEEVVRTLPRASAPTGGGIAVQKAFEPGLRLEREALAGCAFHPELKPLLAELSPEHFENADLRELRGRVLAASNGEDPAVSELRAHAEAIALDAVGTKMALLRLRERRLRRQVARADRSEVRELHDQLRRIREAIDELA